MSPPPLRHRQNKMPEQAEFVKGACKYITSFYGVFEVYYGVNICMMCSDLLRCFLSH